MNKINFYSDETEQAILASCILDKFDCDQILDTLKPEDFFSDINKTIFRIIQESKKKFKVIDLGVIISECKSKMGNNAPIVSRILSIFDNTPAAANVEQYCQKLLELSKKRELNAKLKNLDIFNGNSLDELIEEFSECVKICERGIISKIPNMEQMVIQRLEEIEDNKGKSIITGYKTGIERYDSITSGFKKGDFICIAARPSMGKTALSVQVCEHIAKEYQGIVGCFTLEQQPKQLIDRLLANKSMVDSKNLKSGNLNPAMWNALNKAGERISGSGLSIIPSFRDTIADVRRKARKMKREYGEDFKGFMLDYLQLMSIEKHALGLRRDLQIAEISREFKFIAAELDIFVIALSQLNRLLETRENKEPMMSDLRESGALEQDLDLLTFIYRPIQYGKYIKDFQNPKNKELLEVHENYAKLIIAKQREGPTGFIPTHFEGKFTRFSDWSQLDYGQVNSYGAKI